MYECVEAALNSLGWAGAYLEKFKEDEMDDESLESILESGQDLTTLLASIIPPLGRRVKFIGAFKAQLNGGAATRQASGKGTNATPGSAAKVASIPPKSMGRTGSGAAVQSPQAIGKLDHVRPSGPAGGRDPPKRTSNDDRFSMQGPTSVQIMEFEEVQGGAETRKAILFEKQFHHVIEKCDHRRPVAVLAIAGKANKGKSLFLSYVLRYLKALQQGNQDWMGWNDTKTRQLEGFRWANGYEVVTKGIWIWSEPITCKNSKGQEFDILLMDTQGVFDEKTGEREWNILAGLGILTSSVMILNTSNDVQEDTLKSFQNFLSFGLLALDRDDSNVSTKPFQNLVFLVRDWENHEEFPFGNEGGRRFIKRKLEEKSDHDAFHRKLRKQMKECFEDIDCFLFPYPGKSAREKSFTGSVINASEDFRSFAQEIQNCIEKLVNPDNFPFKTLNGNVLSAKDVLDIFRSYTEIFNSDELPSSNDLYNAAAERCNAVITSKCVTAFVTTLESSLSSVPYLEENELDEAKENAEEDAMKMFRKSRKMGDAEVISAAKKELKSRLDEKFSTFQSQNQIRRNEARQRMETEVREILAAYNAEMDLEVGDDIYEQDLVHRIHNDLVAEARKKFQDLRCHGKLGEEGLAQLENDLQSPDKWLDRVRVNCERLESSITAVFAKVEKDFKSALDPSKFNDQEDLEPVETEARSRALEALNEFSSKLPESKMNSLVSDLTARLDAITEKAHAEVKQNQESLKQQLDSAIGAAAAEYKKSMIGLLVSNQSSGSNEKENLTVDEMPPLTSEELEKLHVQCDAQAWKSLRPFIDTNFKKFKYPIQVSEESREKLGILVSELFSHFQQLAEQKSEKVKIEALSSLSQPEQEFESQMKKIFDGTKDETVFQTQSSDLKSRLRTQVEKSLDISVLGKRNFEDIMPEWDTRVEKLFNHYQELFAQRRQEDKEKVEKAKTEAFQGLAKAEQELESEMKTVFDGTKDETAFQSQLADLKDSFRTRVENSLDVSVLGETNVQESMLEWDTRVEKLQSNYRNLFDQRTKEEQQKLENAKAEALQGLAKAEQEFEAEIKKIFDATKDEAIFQSQSSELRTRITTQVETKVDVAVLGDENVTELKLEWDTRIQTLMTQYQELFAQRRKEDEENAKAEALQRLTDEEQEFESALCPSKFSDEADMAATEAVARIKAMRALKELSPKLPETLLATLESDLTVHLDAIAQNARVELTKNQETLNEQLESTIQNSAAAYKKAMVALLMSTKVGPAKDNLVDAAAKDSLDADKIPPHTPEELDTLHRQCEPEAWKSVRPFIDTNFKKFKYPIQVSEESKEKLASLISELFSNFQRLAEQKSDKVKTEALNALNTPELEFETAINKIFDETKDETVFELDAFNLKARMRDQVKNSMDVSIMGKKNLEEIMVQWDSKVEKLWSHYRDLFTQRRKQHEEKVENAKAEAVQGLTTAEQGFESEIQKVFESTKDETVFQSEATNLKSRFRTQTEKSMDISVLGKQNFDELMTDWDAKAEKLWSYYQELFAQRRKQEEEKVENAKTEALQALTMAEQEFESQTKKLFDGTNDQKLFASEADDLKDRLRTQLEKSIDVSALGQQNFEEIMVQWDFKVEKLWKHYQELFTQRTKEFETKLENAKTEARDHLTHTELEFKTELKNIFEGTKDPKVFELQKNALTARLRTQVQTSMDVSILGENIFQEIMCGWDSKMEKLLTKYEELFTQRDQEEQTVGDAKAQAFKNLEKTEKEFKVGINSIVETTTDDEVFHSQTSDLKARLTSQLENSIDGSILEIESIQEILSKWDAAVTEQIKKYTRLFTLKQKEHSIDLKNAYAKAQLFYSDQMKTVLASRPWYPAEEFGKINDEVLEKTLSKVTDEVSIRPDNIRPLRQSLQALHQKFQEDNELLIPKESHAIGIDLGTTYSCVGVYVNGKVQIIQENEKFTVPSCVYFEDDGTRVVGEAAQDGAFRSPENFIFDAKRLIGRTCNEQVVQDDIKHWNFSVIDVDGQPKIKCRDETLRPEEISAEVLAHLKAMAEKHLGQKVTNAVVTVPAYFNDGQRQATKDAAEIAGLTTTILKEPVAAAIAYRLERTADSLDAKNVLVFDLGGGTFDIAVLTISNWNIDVKAIGGDMHLGGEDFDNAMVKLMLGKIKDKNARDFLREKASTDPETRKKANNFIRRLKLECEKKKRDLSIAKMVYIRLEEVGWTLNEPLTQNEFEKLITDQLEKCMALVGKALDDAKMSRNDIHDVVLVGGSTKIPKVQKLLSEYFNGVQLKHSVNPDQAVAHGAAIQAAMKAGGDSQGRGISDELIVTDVTPFSIGIENNTGDLVVQVPKGSKIPFSYESWWTTASHNQSSASFEIYEGEEPVAAKNRKLGKFILTIPPRKAGEVDMKSTTLVDDEGIVRVKAVCLMNGIENDIVIDTFNGRMTKKEIQSIRMATEERRDGR